MWRPFIRSMDGCICCAEARLLAPISRIVITGVKESSRAVGPIGARVTSIARNNPASAVPGSSKWITTRAALSKGCASRCYKLGEAEA